MSPRRSCSVERCPVSELRMGTLATIARGRRRAADRAPAIAVFGPVAALRERLAWVERRPLQGVTVAVTRARAQASGLAERLRELGADRGQRAGDPHGLAPGAGA